MKKSHSFYNIIKGILREDGSYTKEEFLDRKQEAENEIVATKISLSEARIEQFDIERALAYARNFIRNLDRQWFDLSPQLRPRFQKLVFPDGIPCKRGEGFGTAKLGLIYEINRQSDGDLSEVSGPCGIRTHDPHTASVMRYRCANGPVTFFLYHGKIKNYRALPCNFWSSTIFLT